MHNDATFPTVFKGFPNVFLKKEMHNLDVSSRTIVISEFMKLGFSVSFFCRNCIVRILPITGFHTSSRKLDRK